MVILQQNWEKYLQYNTVKEKRVQVLIEYLLHCMYTMRSIQNTTRITTGFVSSGDTNITKTNDFKALCYITVLQNMLKKFTSF
jgi:hypothetical protein